MKSLQADFFKVMKEGRLLFSSTLPLPFLVGLCRTASQTEE